MINKQPKRGNSPTLSLSLPSLSLSICNWHVVKWRGGGGRVFLKDSFILYGKVAISSMKEHRYVHVFLFSPSYFCSDLGVLCY